MLAIVSLPVLATYLARDETTKPDGFVIETHGAGGHSAPPRGALTLDDDGDPVYGPRDTPDIAKMAALGIPYWLAGGVAHPERLAAARAAGAAGVQVGSAFALCEESGMEAGLRTEVKSRAQQGTLKVRNNPAASPTAFPFKVADLPARSPRPRSSRAAVASATSAISVRPIAPPRMRSATAAPPSPRRRTSARAATPQTPTASSACATVSSPRSASASAVPAALPSPRSSPSARTSASWTTSARAARRTQHPMS